VLDSDHDPKFRDRTIHDRMPVILDPDSYDLWLDPGMRDVAVASDLLKPGDARLMRSYPVSTRINHVVNDDEGSPRPWNWSSALHLPFHLPFALLRMY
jgi:putative SOS response-associated peptidase YedK